MQKWMISKRLRDAKRKRLYYLSVEFLTGRSLNCNLINLCSQENYAQALKELGIDLQTILPEEPEPRAGKRRPGPPGSLLPGQPVQPEHSGHGLHHPLRIRPVPPEARGGPAGGAAGQLAAERKRLGGRSAPRIPAPWSSTATWRKPRKTAARSLSLWTPIRSTPCPTTCPSSATTTNASTRCAPGRRAAAPTWT